MLIFINLIKLDNLSLSFITTVELYSHKSLFPQGFPHSLNTLLKVACSLDKWCPSINNSVPNLLF